MYSIEKFYDHYVIKENNDILFHYDSELEAEKELENIFKEKGISNKDIVKHDLNKKDKNYVLGIAF